MVKIRLFLAINFNDEVKSRINEIISLVKSNSTQGRFVGAEQLHLTLEFLGEVQRHRVDLIKKIMDGIESSPFELEISKAGFFKRSEGDVCWLGVKENGALFSLQKKLHQSLLGCGFELEDRAYKPHITLGRKVKVNAGFDLSKLEGMAEGIITRVDKIDLMKSEFSNGGVSYTVVYSKPLGWPGSL
ncbi:MAG TPA: RNA 2',3'-cyclic phosphodiesterase [Clostridiales bacterium]|nr:RNA 2',3'-cyclic phosphodiesterase [Clostridiales bacterium]